MACGDGRPGVMGEIGFRWAGRRDDEVLGRLRRVRRWNIESSSTWKRHHDDDDDQARRAKAFPELVEPVAAHAAQPHGQDAPASR